MIRFRRFLIAVAAIAVLAGGTATAQQLLTGKDIRNRSLTGVDVRPGSVGAGVLTGRARESLRGRRGPRGARGPSDAYAVRGKGRKPINDDADASLLRIGVPAGDYTVQAKAVLLNSTGAQNSPNCQVLVSTGGRFRALDQVNDIPLNPQGEAGDTAEAVLMGFAELEGDGTIQLRCTPDADDAFSARDRVLIATRVGELR